METPRASHSCPSLVTRSVIRRVVSLNRGSDPRRHVEVHEILYFSGTTRDVVLAATKSETSYDVAVTLQGPFLKWQIIVVIVFWTRAPGLRAEGHRSSLFTSTAVSFSYSGVGTMKFERIL